MNKVFIAVILLLCGLLPTQGLAIERMYGALSAGYTDFSFSQYQDVSDANYRLVLGHQFHRQWYVEGGYFQLLDKTDDAGRTAQANALYLGLLGKASHRVGELFYRLGVLNMDVQAIEAQVEGSCQYGSTVTLNDASVACSYDEGSVAGMVGLGFDWYVAPKTFIRMEVDYIKGQDGLDIGLVNLGVRYNFN